MIREVVWSYGGGWQSIKILVDIAEGRLQKPSRIIMADTSREGSRTWLYHEQYAKPVFDSLGLRLEVARHDLATVDLYGKNGDLLLPVYTKTGKLPTFCSNEWKKLVVRRYLRQLGYGPRHPVIMWLGFSLDEVYRVKQSDKVWIKNHWPLLFDVPTRRHECGLAIERFGLPLPPKSACWMCPNQDNSEWLTLRNEAPEDFEKAVSLDYNLRQEGKVGEVYLHRSLVPLEEANLNIEYKLEPLWECSNVCMT